MNKSKIEWTCYTWNPVTGCTPVSEGCRNCYAKRIFERFNPGKKFSDVVCHEDRLEQPKHIKKPSRIFVNSMSDLFHPDVPDDFVFKVFHRMMLTGWHTYMILTKRPDRMAEYCSRYWLTPLPNVWLGTSIEDQLSADLRLPHLLQTPAAVRFVSVEPMLDNVNLSLIRTEPCDHRGCLQHVTHPCEGCGYQNGKLPIDWVICGGETGPRARPMHPEWVRDLRDQCQSANVPFFFKSWGEWELTNERIEINREKRYPTTSINVPGAIGYNNVWFSRVGKKNSGRLLEGKEWNEFPEEVTR